MNFNTLKTAIKNAAEKHDVKEYEIYYMSSSDISVETLNNEISNFSSGLAGGLCLRLVMDGKMGYASTELMEEAEMESLVERAIENAKYTEKEDTVGIFAGSPSYEKPNLPEFVPTDAAKLKELALATSGALYASDTVQNGTTSAAMSSGYVIRLCNSHGLDLETSAGITAVMAAAVVAKDGQVENNYAVKELKEGTNPDEIAKEAVNNALEKIGAGSMESGKMNVIIDGKQMRAILSSFSSVFSAKSAQMGMSLLAGKENTVIASDIVTISDDPKREGLSIQSYFDAEGVAAYRKNIVENGVLKTLLHNRETAKRASVETTGNASKGGYSSPVDISPYAFCIEAGNYTEDELFALAGNGVYITEVKGLHAGANAVTGDFSIESAGFRIVDGKKAGAVKSFTIAGNFFELLKSVTALSNEVKFGVPGGKTTFGSPNVLIKDMSVAGK
jgi:PmbA protein